MSLLPFRRIRRGALTDFIAHHIAAWELVMATITVVYVLAAIWDDDFGGRMPSAVLVTLALVLLAEFLARFLDSSEKWRYLRRHWIDLVSCVPVVGALRLLRVLRLLRLVAGFRLLVAIRHQLALRQADRGSFWFLGPALAIVWTGSAYAIWALEHGVNPGMKTIVDALYWSAITITTIGYGDIAPVTLQGRIIAGLLAFLGIGLFGFISAQFTARLVGQTDRTADEIARLRTEIAQLRQDLAEGKSLN